MPRGDMPEIGIVSYHLRPGRVSYWQSGGYAVPEHYVAAIRRVGGRADLVLPGDDRSPSELLGSVDALMLVGGGDVEPSRYGQRPSETVYGVEPDRDAIEIDLLLEAVDRGTPTLCICRGMQVMNVAFGGSLIQDLPTDGRFQPHGAPGGEDALSHDVKLANGSVVADAAGSDLIVCPSHHHQGVDRLGSELLAVGWSEDGLVEAIQHERAWIVGVQWHPEETAETDAAQQGLFDALVAQARER